MFLEIEWSIIAQRTSFVSSLFQLRKLTNKIEDKMENNKKRLPSMHDLSPNIKWKIQEEGKIYWVKAFSIACSVYVLRKL